MSNSDSVPLPLRLDSVACFVFQREISRSVFWDFFDCIGQNAKNVSKSNPVVKPDRRIFSHGFRPAASPKALTRISREIRSWALHHRSDKSLTELAQMYNPCIRGWISYYSHFYKTQLRPTLQRFDAYVIRWARHKFRRLRHQTKGARDWVDRLRRATPSSSRIGHYVMAMAEHREPCDSRGSCTVLGAPGGEIPPGDSTISTNQVRTTSPLGLRNSPSKLTSVIGREGPKAELIPRFSQIRYCGPPTLLVAWRRGHVGPPAHLVAESRPQCLTPRRYRFGGPIPAMARNTPSRRISAWKRAAATCSKMVAKNM